MTVVLVHSPVTVPLKLCHVAALNPMKTGAAAAAIVKHTSCARYNHENSPQKKDHEVKADRTKANMPRYTCGFELKEIKQIQKSENSWDWNESVWSG